MGAVWYFPPPPSPTIPACGNQLVCVGTFAGAQRVLQSSAPHRRSLGNRHPHPAGGDCRKNGAASKRVYHRQPPRPCQNLYQALARLCPEEEVFLLSTDLCPAHRTEVIQAIHRAQKEKLPCRVVSTQCIEAGVIWISTVCIGLWRRWKPLFRLPDGATGMASLPIGSWWSLSQRKIGCIPIPTMKTEQPSSAPCRCSNPLISTIQKSSATITGSCSARSGATKSPGHWKRPWPSGIFRQSPNSTV